MKPEDSELPWWIMVIVGAAATIMLVALVMNVMDYRECLSDGYSSRYCGAAYGMGCGE